MTTRSTRLDVRRGFTLIELLVVVAIIALLIAILLPSLGRARERAKMVACGSNVRQMSMMYKMYITDIGSKGIYYARGNVAVAPEQYAITEWMGGLRPY